MRTVNGNFFDASGLKMYAGATGRDLHIDGPLSQLTIGFRPQGMIWDQIMPVVAVPKQSDGYYVWPREDWFRAEAAHRAPKTRAKRINATVSTDTYFAKNFALGAETPWEDLDNADDQLQWRQSISNLIIDNLGLNAEIRMAGRICNTANVGSSNTLAANYSNVGASTPIDDMDNGRESIRSVTGYYPNEAVFGPLSWMRFRKHPDVIDFIRGKGDNIGGGGVTEQQVANAWNLSKVLVGAAIQNTAVEGAPGTYSDVWSNHIALLYVAPSPGIMVPTYGYTFQWKPAGFPAPFSVRRYDEVPEMQEVQEVHHFQDEKVVSTPLGYLIIGG
jgi:hypothetical protein